VGVVVVLVVVVRVVVVVVRVVVAAAAVRVDSRIVMNWDMGLMFSDEVRPECAYMNNKGANRF